MDLKGTHKFTAAPQAVWDALHNDALMKSCIPGAEEVTWNGDTSVKLRINISVGPFSGGGGITGQVSENTPPSHMKIAFSRQGPNSSATGTITIDLAPDGTGTLLTYSGNASLGGAAAVLDNPLTRPMVEGQLNQVFKRLDSQVH
jgi:uncharacterized protein